MNLLLILSKIWKYKPVTIPIVLCVLAGAFYVVAVTAPTYEASATYILVNPPPLPTDAQIARDPALGRIKGDNPYTRFSDQAVLVQVLASRLNSHEERLALTRQGADPNYVAAPSAEFGFSAPILQITGDGTSAVAAVSSANLVGGVLSKELDRMQAIRGVDKTYRITAEAVVPARDAKLKPSGKLRSLVAVLVLGTVLLFISISVLDALSVMRAQWSGARGAKGDLDELDGFLEHVAGEVRDAPSLPDHAQEAPQWPLEAQR